MTDIWPRAHLLQANRTNAKIETAALLLALMLPAERARTDTYNRAAQRGRNALRAPNAAAAREAFQQAHDLTEHPALRAEALFGITAAYELEKKYDEAIAEFGKVLNLYANDKVARKYSYEAHFQQGMGLFEDSDYLAARDQFRASSRYRADCPKCREYMERSEDLYKEIHYRNGIQFFEEEQLLEAIQEWELVEAVDTKYKTVDYLLKKARTILGNIEQIKEGQKEQR